MKHILFSPQPPMMASSRKLLRADENPGAISKKPLYANSPEFLLHISSNNSSASASSTSVDGQRFFRTDKNNSSSAYSYKLSPPFDSSMAVAILVLLVALFFMGFLSVYIRRFADDSSVDPTRRRSRRSSAPNSSASSYIPRTETVAKGADPSVVASLPVYAYDGGPKQKGMIVEPDCSICLSEFEDRECVKVIPLCGHSFHIGCIDMWLSSHVTCPLCRTEQFFPATEDKVVVADAKEESDAGVAQAQGHSESRVIEEIRVVLR